MKKLLALLLCVAMVLSLAACTGNTTTSGDTTTDTSSDTTTDTADTGSDTADTGDTAQDTASDGGKTYRVAMICDSSISDGGWGMSCYNAMVDAAAELGWETAYSDMIEQSAYYESIVAYCDQGYDLIYAPGNQYTDAVLQAASEYPDIAFALLNGGTGTPAEAKNGNVTSLLPDAQQVGWIAGALAGLMTETGTIAFIGGMELDTTQGKYAGYQEAAAYVGEQAGKTVTTLDCVYTNSFSATDLGIEFANAMMDQGADVFFGDASAVDSGARQAHRYGQHRQRRGDGLRHRPALGSAGAERVHHRQPGDRQRLPGPPVHGGRGERHLRRRGDLRHPPERRPQRRRPQRPGARRRAGAVPGLHRPDGRRHVHAVNSGDFAPGAAAPPPGRFFPRRCDGKGDAAGYGTLL